MLQKKRGSMSFLRNFTKSPSGYNLTQMNNFSPEQMELFKSLFSHLSPESQTAKLASGDQSVFSQIEAPAMRQFQQLLGQNASRFSGLGMGARRGSGFANLQNQSTSDFAQDLSSRRQMLQRQALMDLMGLSNQLLSQRPYENVLTPKKSSFLDQLGIGLAGGLGQGLGTGLTGGLGNLFGF